MKISIIIPVYNEEKTIEKIFFKILSVKLKKKQIIIVDDFSIDNLVKRASKLIRLHLEVHHLLTLSIEEIKIACESIVEKAASNLKNKPLKQ